MECDIKTTKNTAVLKYEDVWSMAMRPDYLTILAKGGEIFLVNTSGKAANRIFKEYSKLVRQKIKKGKRGSKTSKVANPKRQKRE